MEKKPLKRAAGLKPYSIDHHQGLLLCWKIRTGLKNDVDINRIATYVKWFYSSELLPHFNLEENYIFPLLGLNNDLVHKTLDEHKWISMLVEGTITSEALLKLAELLENHIRFEERILFEEIQRTASEQQLAKIEKVHGANKFIENTTDEFWAFKK